MKTMTEISKLIAMVLRHKPEKLQLTLDEHGEGRLPLLLLCQ